MTRDQIKEQLRGAVKGLSGWSAICAGTKAVESLRGIVADCELEEILMELEEGEKA